MSALRAKEAPKERVEEAPAWIESGARVAEALPLGVDLAAIVRFQVVDLAPVRATAKAAEDGFEVAEEVVAGAARIFVTRAASFSRALPVTGIGSKVGSALTISSSGISRQDKFLNQTSWP